ncbi:copper amine oxidase N-terminal domain-containing protein [Paenibacillus radicis (ex Xue et al. 2023)]|uniref:Copper amine oxidase N-terminal domain-containing protein n=1 Tax=Paenibacillus radicis (ex Xue et al. 2023) TaxID=2972489 RepID=A0ABT1YIF2_9BACL|nr:copper amine oxidase N-terminal domain-containing protein [Paenibacillus radicis (ex Xue et al. 2023)]MCR8631755.1 copper amine oxidase N-terminal domain-containing protein [Paenibacillus radicis (ex Xue et al. 2023)]
MYRFLSASVKPAILLSTALTACLIMPMSSEAVSVTTNQLKLYAEKAQASLNGVQINLDEPASIINDRFYVPAKWLADTLNFSLEWDSQEEKIKLLTPRAFIEFDAPHNTIKVNGISIPFDTVAVIRNDRLMIHLSWLAQYADIPFQYKEESKSVVMNYIGKPYAPYPESILHKDDSQPNSKPAAVFAFGKPTYRLGEPIEYIDLSYDPDAEGLPEYDWKGKQEAFFQPGVYTVTLQVSDRHGNRSEPFSKSVTVLNEPFVSKNDYPFYFKPAGTLVELKKDWLKGLQTAADSKIPVVVRQPEDKKLIVGSSVNPIVQKGFLYQDSFKQRARLSLQYTNGREKPAQFAIVLRNDSIEKSVHITTTRKAETQASIYTPILAHKTTEQFLISGALNDELSIEPGRAVFYTISSEIAPGQGYNGIYDLETDGEVTVSYVMMEPGETLYNLGAYTNSGQTTAGSGSYPVAEVSWQVEAKDMKSPTAIGIGDSAIEPIIKGIDARTRKELTVQGLGSIRYRIQLNVGDKTTVALHPRSGFFQGAIRVNGNTIPVPAGGLTSNDILLLHRTQGTEKKVDIELMASEGSSAPLDLVMIPLNKTK